MDCPDEDEIVAYAQGHLGLAARARIVEHVDSCPVCVGLVAEAARDTATRIDASAIEPPSAAEPGRLPPRGSAVGRYLVLELIGAGGLGRVVSAYDPELDRKVAIKLLDPRALRGQGAEELRGRLVREAQALAKVRHPNVVAVHDVGVATDPDTAREFVFLAMELVEGTTLREWLLAEPRGWREIRDVFVAAARGLAAAHDAGLVHRDVKPGNILVAHDGRVQVADFGLARALDREVPALSRPEASAPRLAALEQSMTASGAVMGTPAYMAPEQHRGQRVEARADQFGLCVALFEALHGTRPFAGATSEQLHRAAANGDVVEVPARGVPGWLRRVALRGVAADPNDRFASMHALLAALQHDRRRRRWRNAATGVGLVCTGAGLWALVLAPALAPDREALDTVEALTTEARAAAAKAHFAHPPVDAPAEPTAYVKVLELEAQGGAIDAIADARAAELRDEFATTLVGIGDRYWETNGGTPFAAEYYAAALVFDDDHPRALARVGVSIAAMVALRERAAALSFTEPELVAVAPVLALATEDPEQRARLIEEAYAREPEPPTSITASLLTVLGEPGELAVSRGRARKLAAAASVVATAAPSVAHPTDPPPPVESRSPEASPSRSPAGSTPAVASRPAAGDPAGAKAQSTAGQGALRRGDLDAAAAAFHRALAADRNDVAALAGLGEVSFQRRAYESAAKFFERAAELAPRNAELRIDLGDVYFKVLRYTDARTQYDQAQALGHAGAARRIARLDGRLGTEP